MLDIIKQGIKLNQCLALLPLKAVRRVMGDKNSNNSQMVDTAEEIVSLPFVAATRVLDKTCRSPGEIEGKQGSFADDGPGLKNILVNPQVAVFSDIESKHGERRTILTVTGLLCGG